MNEVEFLKRYRLEKPMLEVYASSVMAIINKAIIQKLSVDPKVIYKTPLSFRIKEESSLIQKAFYRDKNYSNPYVDITDKVGGRIVVLFEEQVSEVCKIIEALEEFTFSKDRDFELERLAHPELFIYQSDHYILRNNFQFNLSEIVPSGTPIEIQIRTLLQHAYSELTHDTVYKPNTIATPGIKRLVAKSMALIEVTDNLFSEVNNSLKYADRLFARIISELTSLFPTDIKLETDRNFCDSILDAFLTESEIFNITAIKKFTQEYDFVFNRIKERSAISFFYRQPIIIFIYWLVATKRKIVKSKWPFQLKELEEMFIDLGYSFDKS